MEKFSEYYIKSMDEVEGPVNSSGKPISDQYLKVREQEQAYISELQQLIDEYANKPRDDEYSRRYREIWLKYNPKDRLVKDYHERRDNNFITKS